MATTTTSKQFTINWRDIVKGLVTAFLTAFVTSVYQWISNGSFPTGDQFKTAGLIGLSAAMAYLIKNFFTPAEVVMTGVKNDTIDKINDGAAEAKIHTT
jgi:hypothetical protein